MCFILQWTRYSYEDLNGLDTMIKRMLKKGSEQIVRQFEYYRAAIEQEVNSRASLRQRRPVNQLQPGGPSDHPSHFQYPLVGGATPTSSHPHHSPFTSHTILQNHRHAPYTQSHSHTPVPHHGTGMGTAAALWGGSNGVNPQLAVYASWSSSEHSGSSNRTLRARDLEMLQDEETFV